MKFGLDKLTSPERKLLLKAPVLYSVWAASTDHIISQKEKADAIKLAHLKTFTADPLLLAYYEQVEKNFKKEFQETIKKYAPFDKSKREKLKNKIESINKIIAKLEEEFAKVLHKSLSNYAHHVKKANKTIIEEFVFPIPIKGLADPGK